MILETQNAMCSEFPRRFSFLDARKIFLATHVFLWEYPEENFGIRKFALGVAEDQSTTAGAVGTVFRLSCEW